MTAAASIASRVRPLLLATCAVFILYCSHAHAQELSKRLMLKDGTYQSVTKYEIKGDRVRYLSADRNEWEEMPRDLIDWPATAQYEKDRAAGAAIPEAAGLDKELEAERREEENAQPEVAPGVHLPEDGGFFFLDTIDGKRDLVELHQNSGELNRDTKHNILRGAINPLAANKQLIELSGEHSAVQSHTATPIFYLKPDEDTQREIDASGEVAAPSAPSKKQTAQPQGQQPQQPEQPQQPQQPEQPEAAVVPFNRYFIVKVKSKNGKRTVADIKIAIYGKTSQEQSTVKSNITGIRGGWMQLTPVEPLAPGEYAIVEMLGKEGMNLYVWDFGVTGK